MRRLLVLGAGTAGTMAVNKLHHKLDRSEWTITIVDQDNEHLYTGSAAAALRRLQARRAHQAPRCRQTAAPNMSSASETTFDRLSPSGTSGPVPPAAPCGQAQPFILIGSPREHPKVRPTSCHHGQTASTHSRQQARFPARGVRVRTSSTTGLGGLRAA